MTMPPLAPVARVMKAIPGVGRTPSSSAWAPDELIPETRACASMSPEMRVSCPTTKRGRSVPPLRTRARARPTLRASSGVMGYVLATPRMPSVPKSLDIVERVQGVQGSRVQVPKVKKGETASTAVCSVHYSSGLSAAATVSSTIPCSHAVPCPDACGESALITAR